VPPPPNADAPLRSRASVVAGLVSSLLVLSGVFFFINSACSNGSCDGSTPDIGAGSCNASTAAPPGASIAIVVPAEDASVSGDAAVGTVPVQVVLQASRVKVVPSWQCVDGAGSFEITLEPLDAPDCGPTGARIGYRALSDGSSETTLHLEPGRYTIRAYLKGGSGSRLAGLEAVAHFSVAGMPTAAGSNACP
jgi:hypothetical protein